MKTTVSTYGFLKRFPNEESARLHIEQLRWHDGIICPACNKGERIQKRVVDGYYRCLVCKKDFTVRTSRLRASVLDGTDAANIQNEVGAAVAAGSTLITDQRAAYNGLDKYVHYSVNHGSKR